MSHSQNTRQSLVQVRVLYFEGCPNHRPTVELIRLVAKRLGIELNLKETEVTADDDPDRLGFRGSPTVQISGLDIDPAERGQDNCGFGCRTYGGAGVPDEQMIEAALRNPADPDDVKSVAHGQNSEDDSGKPDCCSPDSCSATENLHRLHAQNAYGSSIAAFGSAIVASACCWLPLLLVGLGLSLSLGGLIETLHAVRPYLLILAAMCLAAGFYMVYFRGTSRRAAPQIALWTALAATLAMAMFPYYSNALFGSGNAVEARPVAANTVATDGAGSNVTLTYEVEGMTCAGCETTVCNAVSQVAGVKQCRASYENGRARAVVSKDALKARSLVEAIESVGFSAKRVER